MAFQPKGSIEVVFSFVDETGTSGTTRAHKPAGTTLAQIKTDADTLAAALLTASGCSLKSYHASASYVNDAVVAPVAGSRVERKGVLVFATAAGFLSELSIPGIVAAAVNPAGGLITTGAPIQAVLDAIVNGGWTDNRGADLTRLDKDYESYRATSRKGKTSDTSPSA